MVLTIPSAAHTQAVSDAIVQEIIGSVDGSRMMDTIQDLQDFGSRAFYLNSSVAVAEYIQGRFAGIGLDATYQEFGVGAHYSRNIVATKTGLLDAEMLFLIGAHYDSENQFATSLALGQSLSAPGADDDASGIAATIEIATVLDEFRLNYTMKYLAFGAEELGYDESGGLRGSSEYVSNETAHDKSYKASAILDMIGYRGSSGNHATIAVEDSGNELARAVVERANELDLDIQIDTTVAPFIRYSDHYPFWASGYPSMLVCEAAPDTSLPYEFNPYYHPENDRLDHLSEEQMVELTKALLAGILSMNGLAEDDSGSIIPMVLALTIVCAIVAIILILYVNKVRK
jgi:leucyl aminopeptidase